ncbi:MAG: hypothetical protein V4507_03310 [Verrucomicrobiota bacterium]
MNIGFHAGRLLARWKRTQWKKRYEKNFPPFPSNAETISKKFVYYTCEEHLPELILSIQSLIRYVGRPEKILIIGDGSLSPQTLLRLNQWNPVIQAMNFSQFLKPEIPSILQRHWNRGDLPGKMAIKLSVFMSLPLEGTTVFLDSDIIFYPGARNHGFFITENRSGIFYLRDCGFSGEERMIYNEFEKKNPVNSGFFVLDRPLDWDRALKRFSELGDTFVWFVDQTSLHLAMHDSHAEELDPQRCVLHLRDQFQFREDLIPEETVFRHYVTPVRHHLWKRN